MPAKVCQTATYLNYVNAYAFHDRLKSADVKCSRVKTRSDLLGYYVKYWIDPDRENHFRSLASIVAKCGS